MTATERALNATSFELRDWSYAAGQAMDFTAETVLKCTQTRPAPGSLYSQGFPKIKAAARKLLTRGAINGERSINGANLAGFLPGPKQFASFGSPSSPAP